MANKSGGCGCGCGHDTQIPELDARIIPHAIRHGAVLGALAQVQPGAAMILAAPHNPLPLLGQIAEQWGSEVSFDYLTEGPDVWRIQLTKQA